jgi:hypothetical protein
LEPDGYRRVGDFDQKALPHRKSQDVDIKIRSMSSGRSTDLAGRAVAIRDDAPLPGKLQRFLCQRFMSSFPFRSPLVFVNRQGAQTVNANRHDPVEPE